MRTDWLTVALALAVLVVPMLLAWAILSWGGRRKPKDNGSSSPTYRKHGKHL